MVEISKCQSCSGEMQAVCSVVEKDAVPRYLRHAGIDYEPPPRAPPKWKQEPFGFHDEKYS